MATRKLCEELHKVAQGGVVGIRASREYKCWHESECESLEDVEVKDYEGQVLCMTLSNYLFSTMPGGNCNKLSPDVLKQRELMISDEISQLGEMEAGM